MCHSRAQGSSLQTIWSDAGWMKFHSGQVTLLLIKNLSGCQMLEEKILD